MMRKRIAAVMAALAVSLFAVLGTGSPAAAASEINQAVDADWTGSCTDRRYTSNVDGCFQPNGDDLWVKDNVANGYGVKFRWYDQDGSRSGECIDSLGKAKAWTYCNKDFPENHTIRWSLCWDSAHGWDCTDWYSSES